MDSPTETANRNNGIFDVKKTIDAFKSVQDGTYEYRTREAVEYDTGYQVSFVRPEAFDRLDQKDWDSLITYCCEYLQSNAHIGVYNGSVEVSFHSMDRSKAEEIMVKFNQESILDWGKKAAYPTSITKWFIMNKDFNETGVVNYHEILKQIL